MHIHALRAVPFKVCCAERTPRPPLPHPPRQEHGASVYAFCIFIFLYIGTFFVPPAAALEICKLLETLLNLIRLNDNGNRLAALSGYFDFNLALASGPHNGKQTPLKAAKAAGKKAFF